MPNVSLIQRGFSAQQERAYFQSILGNLDHLDAIQIDNGAASPDMVDSFGDDFD